ncbi:hypothetical protein FKP32DRAFT_22792 [Trametes sanguinea]|nr:hypothetical protein FKP32DRAFT_31229 [Trametes sanguinea]KAI9069999.1 hypothetical protein FKP32DRAFT_22792 [Trametes sanguinea]
MVGFIASYNLSTNTITVQSPIPTARLSSKWEHIAQEIAGSMRMCGKSCQSRPRPSQRELNVPWTVSLTTRTILLSMTPWLEQNRSQPTCAGSWCTCAAYPAAVQQNRRCCAQDPSPPCPFKALV